MVDRMYSDPRLAALYERLYPLPQATLDFYLPLIRTARSVLDVGCGTGALLAAARNAGCTGRLCGLDPAAAMLSRARARKDVEWVCGEVAALGRAGEFDLAIMTGHAFQVLIEDAELRGALAAVHAALGSGGRFVFETRNPAARAWERWTPEHALQVTDALGEVVQVTLQVEVPFDGRTVSYAQTYSSPGWDAARVSRGVLRFLDAAGVAAFLAEAGFALEAQFGDLDRRALTRESPEIVTVARVA